MEIPIDTPLYRITATGFSYDSTRGEMQDGAVFAGISISVNAISLSNSFYQVLSAVAYSKHGFNIHGVVFDELHMQPNRKLFDV